MSQKTCPLCGKQLDGSNCPTKDNSGFTHYELQHQETSWIGNKYEVITDYAEGKTYINDIETGKLLLETIPIPAMDEQDMLDKIKLLLTFS